MKVFFRGFIKGLLLVPLWEAIARPYVLREREECAKLCESIGWNNKNSTYLGPEYNCIACSNAIKARK